VWGFTDRWGSVNPHARAAAESVADEGCTVEIDSKQSLSLSTSAH
jgi:hypothetical protein